MITTQFHCSFATQSRWVFTYSTRCISTDSWLLLLMISTLLKQSIDALILRTGVYVQVYTYRCIRTGVYAHAHVNMRLCVYVQVYTYRCIRSTRIVYQPKGSICSESICYTISSTVGLIASIFQQVCSILWVTCICLSKY